jgi:phosphohistidine phosphatase
MAAHLSDHDPPGLVLCSSARRACDTLAELRHALGDAADVRIEKDLYGAEADQILHRLRTVDHGVQSTMVIGHNPGLEDLAADLASDGDPAVLTQLRTKFPTGALAALEFPGKWAELGPGRAYLTSLVLPRQLS